MGNIAQELESLGITDYEITTASLEAGSVTIRHHLRGHDDALEAEPVLELGDWTGWLWSREESESGGGPRTVTLTYRDAIGYLDAVPIVLTVRDLYPASSDESVLVPAGRVLEACANAALKSGITLQWSGMQRNVMTVFAGGSGSIWATVREVLRWMPDVRSRVTGSTVELYSVSSGGEEATGAVDLAGCTDGVLTVGSMSVDIGELHTAYAGSNWKGARGNLVARELMICPEAATSVEGTVLRFTARLAGEEGNDIALSCTNAEAIVTPFSGGVDADTGEQPEPITYDAVTSRSVSTSMDNVAPPVVAARGGQSFEIPAGASIYQPGAFVYQVPYTNGLGTGGGQSGKKQIAQQQADILPWQTVTGLRVPDDWETVTNGTGVNMWESSNRQQEWAKFWRGFAASRILSRVASSCITFGKPVIEIVPADEAYPVDDEDVTEGNTGEEGEPEPATPANYEEFSKAGYLGHLYVLSSGQFPASPEASKNVSGLKFCQARIRQFVWLSSAYSGTAPFKDFAEFVSGFSIDSEGVRRRYTCLTLDTVLINRRRKQYQTGTNRLAPEDPDYTGDDGDDTGGSGSGDTTDYYSALYAYYQATRTLGEPEINVSLHGVQGYTPGETRLEAVFSALGYPFTAGRVTWRAADHTLHVTNSRREVLGIDDLLARQQIGRLTGGAVSQNAELAEDEQNNPEHEDDPDEETEWPMVSPSINVSAQASQNWKTLAPFQVYINDEGRHMINGGPLPTPAGLVQAEPTDIEEKWAPGVQFSVKAQWDRTTGTWLPKIICRQKS